MNAPTNVDISRLPRTDEHFVGRGDELALLDKAWADNTNAVSIVAWGGVGKTALVHHWLGRFAANNWGSDDYRGAERVFAWSFYSQGTDKDRVASADLFIDAALDWFGTDIKSKPTSPRDRGLCLAGLVRRKRTLLVLDGTEPLQHPPDHVQAGQLKDPALAALVQSLAAQNDGLVVLTTREKIDELAPFTATTAPRIDLEHLKPEDGAEYLRLLGVQGTENELQTTSAEFDGHALALRLLGNYLKAVHGGEVRRRDLVPILKADKRQGQHAYRLMAAYEVWLDEGPELSFLRLLGLFDRPASGATVRALLARPAIPILTDALVDLDEEGRRWALGRLRDNGLVAPADPNDPDALDAHPLVREYFADCLQERGPEAWRAGHLRLYEYLCGVAPDLPDNKTDMALLYAAVVHGCRAGRQKEAFDEVYQRRILRGNEHFSWKMLGTFGSELTMLSGFFERPWDRPSSEITEADQGLVLHQAGLYLRALGRLTEAVQPMRASVYIDKKDLVGASDSAANLSEFQLTVGEVEQAVASAEESVALADRSGGWDVRMINRTTRADALHQAGRRDESAVAFQEAEALQAEQQPQFPRLYSVRGYRYCDLLLGRQPWGGGTRSDGGIEERCQFVLERAGQSLRWTEAADPSILAFALDHLSLGRAHLGLVLESESPHPDPLPRQRPRHSAENVEGEGEKGRVRAEVAAEHIDQAVKLLRQSGQESELPRGLLARVAVRRVCKDDDGALADLDEAEEIAVRGRMRLYECDVHLERARFAFVHDDLTEARRRLGLARSLVAETGYHRRDEEVDELDALIKEAVTSTGDVVVADDDGGIVQGDGPIVLPEDADVPEDPVVVPEDQDVGTEALALWREKLDDLLVAQAKAVSPDERFAIKKGIEEARRKIAELGGDVQGAG